VAGAVLAVRAALEADRSAREVAADIRATANRNGDATATCGACSRRVRLGLLSEPECPHCAATFEDVEPSSGLFGSATLRVGPLPALDGSVTHPARWSWVTLSGGLADRYRIAFAGFLLVTTTAGLVWLSYKIRAADPESVAADEPTAKLERPDLFAGGDPENTLEWLIAVGNRPVTYAVLAVTLTGGGLVGVAAGGTFQSAGLVLLFGAVLVLTQTFLRFGWPYIERFYEGRQPDERDDDSLRYQGFSRDTMIFLTLAVATFVAIVGLVALEAMVL